MDMTEDIKDKEYLDDPIRLFDSEHSRVYNTELTGNLEDVEETIEIYDSDTESTNTEFPNRETQFILPAKFFDIDRNIELLSQCCPLSIRLTDCTKYFKKIKEKVNLEEFENVVENINGTCEEVIYVDEVLYDESVNKNNENQKNNRSKIENTLFKDCDVKQVSCTLRNNFTNEDKFKDSKRYVDRLDKYTRTVAKAYHKLTTLVGVPTNATNIDENDCSNKNKVNLNNKNDIHFKPDIHTVEDTAFQVNLYKRTEKSKFKNLFINFKQSTNQLKSSNEKNTNTVTQKRIKRKITNDNEKILEHKRKEARGSHSPILPCPFKLMDSVKEMPIDTVICKKINDKRIPHCHMANLNEHRGVKTSNNFMSTNNIKSAKSKINNTPSLPVNICGDRKNMNNIKNISTFNNISMNTFLMPCCLDHAFLQDEIREMRINNKKNTKRKKKKTTVEENTTPKKRLCDASINRIPEEIPSQFSTSLRSQWLNEIDSYIQPCPIQNFSSSAVENELPKAYYEYINLLPKIKKNTKPQQFLRPVLNTYQTQNANDMSKEFRNFNSYGTIIKTNTPKASIVTQKNKEPNTNNVIYIHDQKLEAIQKASKQGNKPQILDKNPILLQGLKKPPAEMTISNITKGNKKQKDSLSNKGYSPAILPIPTFQNTFNNIIKLQVNYKCSNKWKDQF